MPSRSPGTSLPPEDELWEVEHVAQFLKRSESWVYKKTALAVLPVRRLDGWGLRYVPSEIRKWASEANKKKHR
jgi:predicted DNA-binding transcriptional regulator AlpA